MKECRVINIPCIAVCDTNFRSHYVNFAIPGNDDSVDALIFYNSIISAFIVYLKFSSIFLWFLSVKRSFRLKNFKNWFYEKLANKSVGNKVNSFSTFYKYSNMSSWLSNSFLNLFSIVKTTTSRDVSLFALSDFVNYKFIFANKHLVFVKAKLYSLRLLNLRFLRGLLRVPLYFIKVKYGIFRGLGNKLFFFKFIKKFRSLDNNARSDIKIDMFFFKFYFFCRTQLFWPASFRKFKFNNFFFFLYCKLLFKNLGALDKLVEASKRSFLGEFSGFKRIGRFRPSQVNEANVVYRDSFFIG